MGYFDNNQAALPNSETRNNATFRSTGSNQVAIFEKPKPQDYLKKGKESRERVRDFVSRTR